MTVPIRVQNPTKYKTYLLQNNDKTNSKKIMVILKNIHNIADKVVNHALK